MFTYFSVYLSPLVCKKVCYKLCEQHFARSLVIQALKSVAQNLIRQFSRTSSDKAIDKRWIVRIILRSSLYKDDESTNAPWYQQQCKGHLTSLFWAMRQEKMGHTTALFCTKQVQFKNATPDLYERILVNYSSFKWYIVEENSPVRFRDIWKKWRWIVIFRRH